MFCSNTLSVPEGLEDLSVQVVAAVDQVWVTVGQRVWWSGGRQGLAALKHPFQEGELNQVQQPGEGLLMPHLIYHWGGRETRNKNNKNTTTWLFPWWVNTCDLHDWGNTESVCSLLGLTLSLSTTASTDRLLGTGASGCFALVDDLVKLTGVNGRTCDPVGRTCSSCLRSKTQTTQRGHVGKLPEKCLGFIPVWWRAAEEFLNPIQRQDSLQLINCRHVNVYKPVCDILKVFKFL